MYLARNAIIERLSPMELNINDLRKICTAENIEITLHAAKRLEQRGIFLQDIIACIKNGEIIEQYPDDYPHPSCLVLGMSVKQNYLHVVLGSDMATLWIITAYFPDLHKWENDFRKEKR